MRIHLSPNFRTLSVLGVLAFAALSALTQAAGGGKSLKNPDFTQGEKIPDGATHDWNLGPTGARGWMFSDKLETSDARQIAITKIAKQSPADGVLRVGDVILGVEGSPFQYDPRTEFGKAIGRAESTDGRLKVIRWREGKSEEVVVKLPRLGKYSKTAPFDCSKSERIFEQGCEALAAKMKANPKAGNAITRPLNALALLASGEPKYMPIIKEQVKLAAQYDDPKSRMLHAWFYGPANLLLAEYTIATGDRSHMADLERMTMQIVRGQSEVGSWGHRFIREDGRLGGYGMMNAPGLPLTVSLILARKAGVKSAALDQAIAKSARLIRFYVGKGSVPYGDHHPWMQTHDDNGKNGIAAIMFNLLGDAEATTYFSRMCVASYGNERDHGHTGNFLNMLWAMPGVALSGPHASGAWMEEFGWYYDLARTADTTFIHQGPPAVKKDSYHHWDSTGAYLLAYAQPLKKIYLTGKRPSVASAVSVAGADRLIEDGRGWSTKSKNNLYADRDIEQLYRGLTSWSPVVRERSATALAKRKEVSVNRLIKLLDADDVSTRIGACQALGMLKKDAAQAVSALRETLQSDTLWLRIKAAQALAAIGKEAQVAVPGLLRMMTEHDPKNDPRGMQQRYLSFAVFGGRMPLLSHSMEQIDRKALYNAVRAGLKNEDGRARDAIGSVYQHLNYQQIKPLLPAIHAAVAEPAPSGIMFASGIRLKGLEVLAKHKIREGMPLCLEVMGIDKWGKRNRISRCMNALEQYGAAARPLLPQLRKLEKEFSSRRDLKSFDKEHQKLIRLISEIESATEISELRSLKD